ncbi:site-specific integrase [uncultured Sulfitobacter sp.]|uniref:site-specific integrase n=1 Tax=uncultured Sulfitobacter sp. TaxID=191468 RepID=UPI002604C933|nr:site-specific integrase [uncultured Sulfitobacter sp.]
MTDRPTIEEIDTQIKLYFQKALNWSLEFSEVFMEDPFLDAADEAAGLPVLISEYQNQLKSGKFNSLVHSEANELLGPLLPAGEKADLSAIKHACRGISLARMEQYRRLIGDLIGDYSALGQGDPRFAGMVANGYPPLSESEVADQEGETLKLIANRYRSHKEEVGDAKKTIADFDVTMRIAYEVIPANKQIATIDDADIRGVRDLLKRIPPNALKVKGAAGKSFSQLAKENETGPFLADTTQEKRLRFLRAMLNWAEGEGYIDKVPGKKVSVAVTKKKGSTGGPYTKKDLELIFATPIYTGRASLARNGTPGEHVFKDGKFWVPLIGLFSGMRLGEIVQLQRTDLLIDDDVWVFDINRGEDESKKVKTDTSIRQVPVHRTLIDLGLLKMLESTLPGERLFEDLEVGKDGYFSHNFSKWWGRYGRKFGFHGQRRVFHSFRHLFTDALRDLEAPDYVLKSILGHSDKSITANYGHGANLKIRQSYVDKVRYDSPMLNCLIEREAAIDYKGC